MSACLLPTVLWAQRSDTLFVTINLPDVEKDSAEINLTDTNLSFKGKSEGKDYALELEFVKEHGGIDAKAEESKYAIKPRSIQFHLVKKEEGSWGRLLENKQLQKTNVKVDFNKWVDSDEEEEGFNTQGMDDLGGGMGGMPPGMGGMPPGMGGMPPGMGGMPGMGGPGGAGGMDMEKLQAMMAQMGGGAGGAGGMPDMASMMGGMGGPPGGEADISAEDGGDSDDDLPELE